MHHTSMTGDPLRADCSETWTRAIKLCICFFCFSSGARVCKQKGHLGGSRPLCGTPEAYTASISNILICYQLTDQVAGISGDTCPATAFASQQASKLARPLQRTAKCVTVWSHDGRMNQLAV